MTLIDLGEVTEREAVPAIPVDVPRLRRIALAVLALAGLLALTGSAHPEPAGVRRLWSTTLREGESWSMSADTAFVSRLDDKVAAYDLASGKLRWSVPAGAELGSDFPGSGALPVDGLVLVPADPVRVSQTQPDGGVYEYQYIRTTIALDAATGAERWRTGGDAYLLDDSGSVLITEDDDHARTVRLRRMRVADGTELWSRAVTAVTSWVPLIDGGRVTAVATMRDGQVTVYDFADGTLARSTRIPLATKPTDTWLMASGDYLVVARSEPTGAVTSLYDPADLSRLWYTVTDTGYVQQCGDMLCSLGGGGLSGHLPRTGTQEWVLPGVRDLVMINHDRMVVTDDFSGGNNYLVDPATGRAVGAPVAGRLVADQRPGGAPLVLRPTDDPPGRLAVVALDPADGGRHTLGTVPVLTADDRCSATTGYLACVRAVGGTSTLEITAVG